jgi:hypothetical protein
MNYRLFHGSRVKGLTALRASTNRSMPVIYFSDEPNVAATYAHGGKVYSATVTMNRPMVVDAKGRDWENAGGRNVSTDALAGRAYAQGHDGIIIKNVVDEVDEEGYPVPDAPPNNIYAVFDAAQVKLTRRNPAVTGRGTGRGGTADAGDSKSPGHRGRVGSSPTAPTIRYRRNSAVEGLTRIVQSFEGESLHGRAGREFSRLLQDEGYEVVGAGGARIVIGLGPALVAKIDMDADSVANNSEADFYRWNRARTGALNPVLSAHASGRIIVMPRAEVVFDKGVPARYRKELRAARDEVAALPDAEERVDHQYDFNWGLVNGAVQLLDYNA